MYQQLKRASMALTLSSVCFLAFAQKTIQGTVKDANGEPMIGVTITDQNGKAGGITDLEHGTSYLKMTMQLWMRSLSLVTVLCANAT